MYDFVIVGGGIIGLSVGMSLTERFPQATVALLEKESRLAYHQTGHNSGVIHSGIYYKPGSFKAKFTHEGNRSMQEFCQLYGIPFDICGKVIVATHASQLPRLETLYHRGSENGLNVRTMTAEEVKEIEPHVSCMAGIYVPKAGIVDYKQVCQKYADLLREKGGEIHLNTKVNKIIKTINSSILETNRETFETRYLINCAGLYSDRMAKLGGVDPQCKIVPFRGEYYELIPQKRYLVKNLIYPVPNPAFPFLGVHFTRMINGSIHAGPNAVLSFKREGYKKSDFDLKDLLEVMTFPGFWKLAAKHADEGIKEMIRSLSKAAFLKSLQQLIPEIQASDIMPSEAGVRAQALKNNGQLVEDFLILQDQNSLHVCNAPSPAATASLAIGKAVVKQIPALV